MADLSKKGWVKEFDGSPNMNWWKKVSCSHDKFHGGFWCNFLRLNFR
jgi:hypothetical protein